MLDPTGPECWCGNRGCLQVYTSIPVGARGGSLQAGASYAAPGRGRRGAGDPAIARVLTRVGEVAGTAMAGVCNVLNPRRWWSAARSRRPERS